MSKCLRLLWPWLALVSMAAQAGHQVDVLATFPPGEDVVLGPQQAFHLRIGYATDSITRIHARPYFKGREVDALNSPSPGYRGSGETAAWFTLADADDEVDEVRIFTGNSGRVTRRPPALIHRVAIRSTRGPVAERTVPAWVASLEESVIAQTGGPPQPESAGEIVGVNAFLLVVFASAVFGFVAPVWCFRRWRGRWRIAAAIPMVGMALFVAFLLVAALFDSGSLNLLPFVVLMAALPSSLFIVLLFLARKWSGAARAERA